MRKAGGRHCPAGVRQAPFSRRIRGGRKQTGEQRWFDGKRSARERRRIRGDGARRVQKAGRFGDGRKQKWISLALVFALTAGLCAGCGAGGDEGSSISETASAGDENTIIVLNYGEYLDPSLLRDFEKETGIRVLYEEATTPEEMYSKYKASTIAYDLVCTSDYMVERLIDEGEAVEIPMEDMDYIGNIGGRYWEMARSYDPENRYSIPYFWGTVGILYDSTKAKGPIDSWNVLFDGSYAGEILMQNSIRDAYMCALKLKGYSLNTTDRRQLAEAQEMLLAQKPDVEAYFVDEVREEMVAGNATVSVIYSGEAYLANEYNEDLQYVVPKEGSNVWVDSWVMLRKGKNHAGAVKFLDFLCREDVAGVNFEYVYYPTPNEALYENLDEEVREDPLIFPSDEVLDKCEVYETLDPETTALYSRMWKELKTE